MSVTERIFPPTNRLNKEKFPGTFTIVHHICEMNLLTMDECPYSAIFIEKSHYIGLVCMQRSVSEMRVMHWSGNYCF